MKKLFITLIAALILGCGNMIAESHRIYAVLVFEGKGTPVLVQETTNAVYAWRDFNSKANYLLDAEGNEVKFNNFLPLLGYVETIGWTIPDKEEQIYKNLPNTVAGRSTFLLYKEVSEDEWLQWIDNGMIKNK